MLTISDAHSDLIAKLKPLFNKRELKVVDEALELAERAHRGQKRGTGEPYVCHSISVASIVAGWHVDAATIAAAILHDVPEDTDVTLTEIRKEFGDEVAMLVESVTKLSKVRVPREDIDYEVENLRHLFLAMAQDLRVVLLKLADRLHNMRTMKGVPERKRARIGRETLEIYAPLADRLGMGEVRSELDDLGFRYALPKDHQWTRKQIEESDAKRTKYIALIKHQFQDVLAREGIEAEISARVKNTYSLYKKLLQKERDIDKVYDLFAIRVIVDSVEACYQGMGVIHQHWQPLPHRIKDYIAVPKLNGYRSLHTTIFGPEKRLLEVQLRTQQMHEEAELGVAAHAIYADAKKSFRPAPEQLAVMRQLGSWRDEIEESNEFVDRFKLDMFSHRIFAFTPKGALYSLPAGATPIDFAFYVHTEVGQTCRGAKVNGAIVPLDYALENGDVVEVLTHKGGTPKRDWLTFARTGHARNQIRAYFRKERRSETLAAGRQMLDEALARYSQPPVSQQPSEAKKKIVRATKAKDLDAAFVQIGEGTAGITPVLRALNIETVSPAKPKTDTRQQSMSLAVAGLTSLLTKRARCCKPVPPDLIVGYITLGKGISIHRKDCKHVAKLPDHHRILRVTWER